GQGHRTAFAQLVAGVLGIDIDRVRVEQGDTASAPAGWGTSGSRSIAQGGSASHAAAEKVAGKAKRIASHILEVAPEDIVLGGGSATVAGTDFSVSWEEVVSTAVAGTDLPEGM